MSEDPKSELIYRQQIEGVTNALPSRLWPVCLALLAGFLTALLLGSEALLNWINNLPIGPVSDFLLLIAQSWQDAMARLGLTDFADGFTALLTNLQSLHW
jgi:hypothetical protein